MTHEDRTRAADQLRQIIARIEADEFDDVSIKVDTPIIDHPYRSGEDQYPRKIHSGVETITVVCQRDEPKTIDRLRRDGRLKSLSA